MKGKGSWEYRHANDKGARRKRAAKEKSRMRKQAKDRMALRGATPL